MQWIDTVLQEVDEDDSVRDPVLLRKGIFKQFYEEAYPIYLYLKAKGLTSDDDVKVKISDEHEPYDVKLFDAGRDCEIEKIEITNAVDGYDDALRMEFFAKHGHVSMTGPIKLRGTGRKRQIVDVPTALVAASETDRKLYELVKVAVIKKIEKGYDESTALLIVIDDHLQKASDRNLDRLEGTIECCLEGRSVRFKKISVIGLSGDLHYEREMSKP